MTLRRSLYGLCLLAVAAVGCESSSTAPPPFVPLDSLSIAPLADTLQVGEGLTFTVVAIDTGGVPVADPFVSWRTTVIDVLRITSAGVVTALNEGVTSVIATSGGLADTARVVVLPQQEGWFAQFSNTGADLNGLFMLPDGNTGWAVGSTGRILRTTNAGRVWNLQASGTGFALNDVWFTSAVEGWAVGAGGTVLHTTNAGTFWTRVSAGASEVLNGVTFATRDTGWVVGSGGVVLRTTDRGETWSRSQPTTSTLRGVAFSGTRDGWAVGDGGVILGTNDRGLSWFLTSAGTWPLRAVVRPSFSAARAVGDQGTTPRTVAEAGSVVWEVRNAGASFQLYGVAFVDSTLGFAVGTNGGAGAVLRTENGGFTWSAQGANTLYRLNDVQFLDARRGWAVGNNGVILHTGSGGEP